MLDDDCVHRCCRSWVGCCPITVPPSHTAQASTYGVHSAAVTQQFARSQNRKHAREAPSLVFQMAQGTAVCLHGSKGPIQTTRGLVTKQNFLRKGRDLEQKVTIYPPVRKIKGWNNVLGISRNVSNKRKNKDAWGKDASPWVLRKRRITYWLPGWCGFRCWLWGLASLCATSFHVKGNGYKCGLWGLANLTLLQLTHRESDLGKSFGQMGISWHY